MTVALIGLGLIGGSFARDLRTSGLTAELLGVDADPAHAARALELGLVDRIVALGEAAREADALLLAVPVNAIETLLPSLLDTARDGQTV
ncbi:MAG TPA: prephenate dehydrogenase/arogenate dehydrogenase family protein, partial [Kiritimatiellia bacterium]|nr:prephenate dehydrogenase/arogenate dehydrogenase family protein [Kiritimatiellia bacterium]